MSKKTKLNQIAIVLDRSGSMAIFEGPRGHIVKSFNQQLQKIREETKRTRQKTRVSYYTFGDNSRCEFKDQMVKDVKDLTDFRASEWTALNDGIVHAVQDLMASAAAQPSNVDVSSLVIIVTDGAENHSLRDQLSTANLIRQALGTDRFTFAFMGPAGSKLQVATRYGIPEGCVSEWDQTEKGLEAMTAANTKGTQSFYTARTLGATSLDTFYTDLTGVSSSQVKRELDDVTSKASFITAKKETEIKKLVENHTRKAYVKGSAFYQLMKEEKKVQAYKQILVLDKVKNRLFGGSGARDLLGLPDTTVKIVPQNHSNFEVFVQSTSVNRKIPRGTKVVVLG